MVRRNHCISENQKQKTTGLQIIGRNEGGRRERNHLYPHFTIAMAAVVKGIILVSLKCKLQGIRNLNLKKPQERQKLSYLATKNSTFARFA